MASLSLSLSLLTPSKNIFFEWESFQIHILHPVGTFFINIEDSPVTRATILSFKICVEKK